MINTEKNVLYFYLHKGIFNTLFDWFRPRVINFHSLFTFNSSLSKFQEFFSPLFCIRKELVTITNANYLIHT